MVRFNLVITLLLMINMAVKAELTNRMFDVGHVGYAEILVVNVFFDCRGWRRCDVDCYKTGIDRYNGHTVKNYDLPGSFYYGDLAGRRLYLLYDAQQGLFAYDHTGRIYRYSTILDHFEQVLHLGQLIREEVILNKLCLDSDGTWWMGADKGLYKQEADHRIVAVLKGQYVNDIAFAGESLLWVLLTESANCHTPCRIRNASCWKGGMYKHCSATNRKELWIGTFGSGLSVMNLDTSKVLALEGQGSTFLHPIRAITDYDVHTILIGVDGGGVYAIDKDTKKARLLMNTKDDTDTYLRGNGVYAVTRDDQGNIWIGSYTGGVSVAILLKHPISILIHEKGNTHSLISNNVNDIEENPDGNQWFATDDGISIRNTLSALGNTC